MAAIEEKIIKTKDLSFLDMMYSEPGAKEFLESISRSSKSSQRTYASALVTFHRFLAGRYTLVSIIEHLKANQQGQEDVYKFLNEFVSYLLNEVRNPRTRTTLSVNTIKLYVAAVRSYFQFNDIDIVIAKFKRKVKMPKLYREDEEAIDAADIRKILLSCNNRRLKAYLLTLASGGFRANEACGIRLCDINFDLNPTKIHIRKEYAKTRVARDIYISDEATRFLKEWMGWKYRKRRSGVLERIPNESDLIFAVHREVNNPRSLYEKIRLEFLKVLDATGFDKRKEGMLRRLITLHSFRRHVKTVISDQVSKDYSEWFLGHSKSPYYTMKEPMRREIYATKCMKYLTYLDYSALESTGKSIEKKLEARQDEIQALRQIVDGLGSTVAQLKSELVNTRRKMAFAHKYGTIGIEQIIKRVKDNPNDKEFIQRLNESLERKKPEDVNVQLELVLQTLKDLKKSGRSEEAEKLRKAFVQRIGRDS
jgi:integrase